MLSEKGRQKTTKKEFKIEERLVSKLIEMFSKCKRKN